MLLRPTTAIQIGPRAKNKSSMGIPSTLSSMKGWASYKPYMAVDYMVAGEGDDSLSNSAINFNGLLSARVLTPIGPLIATFPDIDTSNPPPGQKISEPTLSIPKGNVVYSSGPGKGVSGTSDRSWLLHLVWA